MKEKFDGGKAIREARKKAGLSQRKLAEKTKISESEICAYENNRRKPGMDKYAAIAHALNISIDELYYGNTTVVFSHNASSEGEIIAQCIRLLWEREVASLGRVVKYDSYGEAYIGNTDNGIILKKYSDEITSLLGKLETYADDKEKLPDPESFMNQIVQVGARAIDARADLELMESIPF